MARYRYLFHDLRTNALVAELPLVDLSYSPSVISAAGEFSASLPALDAGLSGDLDVLNATKPARRVLYVEREDVLVYAGIVWTRRYDSRGGRFVIGGSEPSSYLAHRRSIPADRHYVGVAEQTIFVDLVNLAMTSYASNIGIAPVVAGTAGSSRTRSYIAAELKPISQSIEELAEDDPGFEWANEIVDVDGIPTKVMRAAERRRGRTADDSGLVFEYPGNVLSFDWPEDGAGVANFIWGLGQGEGANTDLLVYSHNPGRLEAEGYPLLEDVLQASEVRDAAHLQGLTTSERLRRDAPIELPTFTVKPDVVPDVGTYSTGDRARAYLDDPRRFGAAPWEGFVRILKRDISVSRTGTETVVLTLAPWPYGGDV